MAFRRRENEIERLLRAQAPEPGDDFVRSLADRTRRAPALRSRARLAFAGVLSAAMLVALASVGGLSYAATAVTKATKTIAQIASPSSPRVVLSIGGITSGGDQYRPGYGWGDHNHVHPGPPRIKRVCPVTRRKSGRFLFIRTCVSIDEQAHLVISVFGPKGKQLQIVQSRSKIGQGVKGPNTKNIRYQLLVPRTIPIVLAIPKANVAGGKYRIRIWAKSPLNKIAILSIPFSSSSSSSGVTVILG